MTYRIEPLGAHHDRGVFCCGNATIDDFCVVGFYSLVVSTLEPRAFLGFGKRDIPAVYLAMVGVHEPWRMGVRGDDGVEVIAPIKGTGTALMVDAFRRTITIADNAGVYCLWLDAVDEKTAEFYESLDFVRITDGKLRM